MMLFVIAIILATLMGGVCGWLFYLAKEEKKLSIIVGILFAIICLISFFGD